MPIIALPTRARSVAARVANRLAARLAPGRPYRVVALVAAVALLSVADLHLTLLFLLNGGMGEANPIARWVIGLNCGWILTLWKLSLSGLACGILLWARQRWSAELGAWVACAVMLWLGLQWIHYAEQLPHYTAFIHDLAHAPGANWVAIEN